MARAKSDWDTARAMFEGGASLAEIAKETHIDKGSLSRKAKQDGWEKGKKQPLVEKEVQARQAIREVEAEKATLNATERVAHDSLVARRLRQAEYFEKAHLLVAKTVRVPQLAPQCHRRGPSTSGAA